MDPRFNLRIPNYQVRRTGGAADDPAAYPSAYSRGINLATHYKWVQPHQHTRAWENSVFIIYMKPLTIRMRDPRPKSLANVRRPTPVPPWPRPSWPHGSRLQILPLSPQWPGPPWPTPSRAHPWSPVKATAVDPGPGSPMTPAPASPLSPGHVICRGPSSRAHASHVPG